MLVLCFFVGANAGTYEKKPIVFGSWTQIVPAGTDTEKVQFTHGDVWCVSQPIMPDYNITTKISDYFKYEVSVYGKDRDINRLYIDAFFCTKALEGGSAFARIKIK